MKKVWLWIRQFGLKLKLFFKKYGFDAVLALIVFNFPMYAIFWIQDAGFVTFAAWWTALWWGLGPLTPGWLITIILAIFFRWARLSIWKGILWIREAMVKLQLQNQLATHLTAEEIKMILEMAKKVSSESDKRLAAFKEILRKERLEMIDDQWSKEIVQQDESLIQDRLDIEKD